MAVQRYKDADGNWHKIAGGGGGSGPTDGSLSDTSENPVQNRVIKAALDEKQDILESGVNIKTINGYSILGSGNLKISGGSGDGDKYSAKISLTTPQYNAVSGGSTGHYIGFTFDTTNGNGDSVGEGVTCTYTITRGTSQTVISEKYRYNTKVRFGVDQYLSEGENTIVISIVGDISGLTAAVGVTYQVVNIVLESDYDISNVVDLSKTSSSVIEVPFRVEGYGTKTVEWYLDGVKLDFVKNEDEIVDVASERTKYITIANLQQGAHSLQARASVTINGEKFYTPTLYRDVIVYTGVSANTIIGIAMNIPAERGIVSSTKTLYGITQYNPYTLRFATYSPSNKLNVQVEVSLGKDLLGVVNSNNGIVNEFSIVVKSSGNDTISLVAEDAIYQIPVVIEKTSMEIEEITSALTLDFSAIGKTNSSANKDSWSFGQYIGTFSGFNWNPSSGWSDNRLKINDGAAFSINYAPLAGSPTSKGRTLEFEFMTTNVNDDDAVICDLRNDNGVGLLITATKVALMSEAGVVVENEFKANEEVRIGIVINRASGSSRRGLSMIYANGCVSRCENWDAADSYESDAQITFIGSLGAEVELKAIRIYETALTDDNMLNNYILYRDTVAEMQEVYDRNDVYVEGTTTFSPDKMVSRLPVMIVTGNIPELENTSDKNKQIVVDVEYTDMQDPTRSFKMIGAAMRPQGTSSMGYPKKNFRIYTQELESTILCDAEGKIVADKLYSFKQGAIPVNCWCLKADYAESSGTHNTGIARMWNKALFDMQIDGEYVCRTDAQKAALESGYPYDVRTTIDGFPILLFYRRNANDEPIFIGKYNFNNDKSTEAVFGFTGIPGFDNSRMQCWEILNNGNPLALFQTMDNFDSAWKEAYESRYPDTKTPNLTDLKAFSTWMVGVNGDHARFATEKWQHFKVYPMAAYYCYLMRHAAADQLVKNAMLTSEDGEKFYFILYDNDTINGLNNIGEIDLLPTDDRNSVDASGQYKFAGHSSVLWNMLEADEEFMQIVKDVDNALYSAGISYNECIRMFDEEQAEKWVERVYNQDSEYKYVGPFVNNGINNLEMLQGRRDLHRRWWLSKRFSIYDAKFVSGEYKSQAVELKCMNDTPAGQSFSIKAGYPLDYGYGINNVPRETGVTLAPGESHTFTTTEVVNLGDPIRIYGAPNIAELDLSPIANRLSVVNIANVYTEALGTRLEKLTVGGEGVNNVEVSEISGLKMAKKLTHLNIQGMRGIKALDLTSQSYFEKLSAVGSEIASVSFAKGAPVTRLELPTTMKALNLEQLPYLTTDNLIFENIVGIHTINIKGCPKLSNSFEWVKAWYDSKATVDAKCTLIMDNVDWKDVLAEDILKIAKLGVLELKGKVSLTEINVDQINALSNAFGDSAFDKNSSFYIDAPAAIFVSGRTELVEGESEQYQVIVFGAETKRITWSIASGSNSYVNFDTTTGLLQVREGYGSGTIVVRMTIVTDKGSETVDTSVAIKAVVYPTQALTSIAGNSTLEKVYEVYNLQYATAVTGRVTAVWSLTGLDGYASIYSSDNSSCVIKKLQESASSVVGTLTCDLRKSNGDTLFTVNKTISVVNDTIAETDAGICKALYDAGLIENETFVTKDEAKVITADLLQPGSTLMSSVFYSQAANISSFDGFKYFTAIRELKAYTFYGCSAMASITLPAEMTSIGDCGFGLCRSLSSLVLPETITTIGKSAFYMCSSLVSIAIPSKVSVLQEKTFIDCTNLANVTIGEGVTEIGTAVFQKCSGLKSISIPSNVKILGQLAFASAGIETIDIADGVQQLQGGCFQGATSLKTLTVPSSVTVMASACCYYCTSLTEVAILGNVGTIPVQGFSDCMKLKKVTIAEGNREIGSKCFQNSTVQEVTIPTTMETLASECFSGCSQLRSIVLPASIKSIGGNAFRGCVSLSSITSYRMAAISLSAAWGNATSNYTGRNTYNTGANILLVPSGATGYDTGEWLDPLCNADKCGFTLSATL